MEEDKESEVAGGLGESGRRVVQVANRRHHRHECRYVGRYHSPFEWQPLRPDGWSTAVFILQRGDISTFFLSSVAVGQCEHIIQVRFLHDGCEQLNRSGVLQHEDPVQVQDD